MDSCIETTTATSTPSTPVPIKLDPNPTLNFYITRAPKPRPERSCADHPFNFYTRANYRNRQSRAQLTYPKARRYREYQNELRLLNYLKQVVEEIFDLADAFEMASKVPRDSEKPFRRGDWVAQMSDEFGVRRKRWEVYVHRGGLKRRAWLGGQSEKYGAVVSGSANVNADARARRARKPRAFSKALSPIPSEMKPPKYRKYEKMRKNMVKSFLPNLRFSAEDDDEHNTEGNGWWRSLKGKNKPAPTQEQEDSGAQQMEQTKPKWQKFFSKVSPNLSYRFSKEERSQRDPSESTATFTTGARQSSHRPRLPRLIMIPPNVLPEWAQPLEGRHEDDNVYRSVGMMMLREREAEWSAGVERPKTRNPRLSEQISGESVSHSRGSVQSRFLPPMREREVNTYTPTRPRRHSSQQKSTTTSASNCHSIMNRESAPDAPKQLSLVSTLLGAPIPDNITELLEELERDNAEFRDRHRLQLPKSFEPTPSAESSLSRASRQNVVQGKGKAKMVEKEEEPDELTKACAAKLDRVAQVAGEEAMELIRMEREAERRSRREERENERWGSGSASVSSSLGKASGRTQREYVTYEEARQATVKGAKNIKTDNNTVHPLLGKSRHGVKQEPVQKPLPESSSQAKDTPNQQPSHNGSAQPDEASPTNAPRAPSPGPDPSTSTSASPPRTLRRKPALISKIPLPATPSSFHLPLTPPQTPPHTPQDAPPIPSPSIPTKTHESRSLPNRHISLPTATQTQVQVKESSSLPPFYAPTKPSSLRHEFKSLPARAPEGGKRKSLVGVFDDSRIPVARREENENGSVEDSRAQVLVIGKVEKEDDVKREGPISKLTYR